MGCTPAPADPEALAEAMARAAEEMALWQRAVAAIRAPVGVDEAAEAHLALYRSLGVPVPRGAGSACGEERQVRTRRQSPPRRAVRRGRRAA